LGNIVDLPQTNNFIRKIAGRTIDKREVLALYYLTQHCTRLFNKTRAKTRTGQNLREYQAKRTIRREDGARRSQPPATVAAKEVSASV
jgi:hypothetical protein